MPDPSDHTPLPDSADPEDLTANAPPEPRATGVEEAEPDESLGVSVAEEREMEDAVEQLIEEVGVPQTQPRGLFGGERLRGRVALITGGSRGIGTAVARELAANGVHIAFTFLDDGGSSRAEAQAVARELRQLEVRVYCRACDVRHPRDVDRFVDEAKRELGGLHILINNAGIGADRALWRMQDDDWQAVMRTNLDGCFHFIRAVAPIFREQEDGKIVNIASVHGVRSEFGLANYAASKAGVIGLTRSAAVELGPRNINVNAVAPGYIRTTRLTERVPAEILDRAREKSVLGRLGDPRDVAAVVLFLCSEAARHITGAVIPVDGGYLL